MISVQEAIQLAGTALAWVVVVKGLAELIRDWRGGTPEIRLVRDTVSKQADALNKALDKIGGSE